MPVHDGPPAGSVPRPVPERYTLALAWFLGCIFVVSAVAKMFSLGSFELYVVQQGLLPSRQLAAYAARLLLAAELFLGLACFSRSWFRRLTLPAAFGMLLVFSLYLAYLAFVKGDSSSCHCFGELLPMSPLHSLFKNVALLAIVAFLYRQVRGWPTGTWRLPVGLALASVLVVGLGFPVRRIGVQPTTAQGTSLGAGSQFARFNEFDGRAVDLTAGVCLVGFVSLDCEHCQSLVMRLGEAARQQSLPAVYLVCYGDAAAAPQFLAETGTEFPLALAAPGVFFDYIGDQPPRLYLLEDGHVRAYWDDETFEPAQCAPWWPPG